MVKLSLMVLMVVLMAGYLAACSSDLPAALGGGYETGKAFGASCSDVRECAPSSLGYAVKCMTAPGESHGMCMELCRNVGILCHGGQGFCGVAKASGENICMPTCDYQASPFFTTCSGSKAPKADLSEGASGLTVEGDGWSGDCF